MRESGPTRGRRQGDARASGYPRAQGGYTRGAAAQGMRSRPTQGAYQKSQPQSGYGKVPVVSIGGLRVPLPALRIGTVLLLSAITVAVVVGLVNNASQKSLFSKTITAGIKIDGRDVSGMDVDRLNKQLKTDYQKKINDVSVKITYNGQVLSTLNGRDIGMSENVDEVVSEAAILARTGSAESRKAEARQVKAAGREFDVKLSINANALKIKLTEIASTVSKPGKDATVSFNANLMDFGDPEEPTKAELDKIPSMFTINPESAGQTVDIDGLENQILEKLNTSSSFEVELVASPFVPKVTSDTLRQTFRILSVFNTHISGASTAERINNIKTAIKMFNSMTLNPGQEVSFNDTTGPRTADNGYQMAHVINGKSYVDDWGGGVCQASSTLYNAALLAGCKITDSGPHSIPSDYIKKTGFDAMVNYASKADLRFVNPYDTPIYIKTFVTSKKNVYVMFFGKPLPDGQKISLDNEITFKGPTPVTNEVMDDGTYSDQVTYKDQKVQVMAPHPEIRVVTYRIYKDRNGNEVKREKLREDHYKEVEGKIVFGKEDRPSDTSKPVTTSDPNSLG